MNDAIELRTDRPMSAPTIRPTTARWVPVAVLDPSIRRHARPRSNERVRVITLGND